MTSKSRLKSFFKTTLIFSSLCVLTPFSSFATDIDANDDGLVDTEFTQHNLLLNNSFDDQLENWSNKGVSIAKSAGHLGDPENQLLRDDGGVDLGSITQEVIFSNLGITDNNSLDSVLAANQMQVSFGGWLATSNQLRDTIKIQVLFKDANNEQIGEPVALNPVGTGGLNWLERKHSTLIPEGTRSIVYSMHFDAYDTSSYLDVFFDDAFLFLEPAVDSDLDNALDAVDVDTDNDGQIDIDFQAKNLLKNPSFSELMSNWETSDVYAIQYTGNTGGDYNFLVRENAGIDFGSITQELILSDIGLTNDDALDEVFSANQMQVSFGGWFATSNQLRDTIKIQLLFKDANNEQIGEPVALNPVGTGDFNWLERKHSTLIPEGTRSIVYSMYFDAYDTSSYLDILFDDAFLFLEAAVDSDLDNVLDAVDVDTDNDGQIDIEFQTENLLKNSSFSDLMSNWETSDVYAVQHAGNTSDDNNFLVHDNGGIDFGSITQELILSDIGLTNSVALDEALSANQMQVSFGGWFATSNQLRDTIKIQLLFKDANNEQIGEPVALNPVGTGDFTWLERKHSTLIPEGTRSIVYSMHYNAYDTSSYIDIYFDDAFLLIEAAVDSDLDNAVDTVDVDADNDGQIDNSLQSLNLLKNPGFENRMSYWESSSVYAVNNTSYKDDDENLLVRDLGGDDLGSITQELFFSEIGLTDENSLNNILSDNKMQVSFGGWLATEDISRDTIKLQLTFKDANSKAIGESVVLDPIGTGNFAWVERQKSVLVPEGTRSIVYTMYYDAYDSSSFLDIYFDDAYLYLRDLRDTDKDGLTNFQEFEIGTNPNDKDSDGDGMSDGYEYANALNPNDNSDKYEDTDNDGLNNFQEFQIGTNPYLADSDNDGIADLIDTNPNMVDVIESSLLTGQLVVLQDVNSDEVNDYGVFSLVSDENIINRPTLTVFDSVTDKIEYVITWPAIYQPETVNLVVFKDRNNNGFKEVGVFGVRTDSMNEGKPQLFLKDLKTKSIVQKYNWVTNWRKVKLVELDDLTGDSISEIAIQGLFKEGKRPQLVIKDGATAKGYFTVGFPNLYEDPVYQQMTDITGDGIGEIALFGRLIKNQKLQVKIVNGTDASDKLKSYNFPNKWENVSWNRLSDSDFDTVDDWGLFGTNSADSRPQLINKSGVTPKGALRIYAWPDDFVNTELLVIKDMNDDGIDEVAVVGLRQSINKYQMLIKNGQDRNEVIGTYNWPSNWHQVSFMPLPDLSLDNIVELAAFGKYSTDNWMLIIKDGSVGEHARYNFGSDWQSAPQFKFIDDLNDDGVKDFIVFGKNMTGETVIQKWSGKSADLLDLEAK